MADFKEKMPEKGKIQIQKEVKEQIRKVASDYVDGMTKRGFDKADVLPSVKKGIKDAGDSL